MTGSSQHHNRGRTRVARTTPAVAPVARAIRAALAASATVLALSGPATAAGICGYRYDAQFGEVCGRGLVQGHQDAAMWPPFDLTRVLDQTSPASIIPVMASAGVESSADIAVSGHDDVRGIDASDFAYDVTVVNDGDLDVDSSGVGGAYSPGNHAFGIRASSYYGNASVENTGTIDAHAGNDPDWGYAYARGVLAISGHADAATTNSGSIDAAAEGEDWALAFGVYNIASGLQQSTVDNSGQITATAITYGNDDNQWAWAAGARATAIYPAYGAVAGHDEVSLHNSGDITGTARVEGNGGNAVAWGAYTMSLNPGGTSTLENDGSISSSAHAGVAERGYAYALGALATARDGTTVAINHGDVEAVARNDAAGGLAQVIGFKSGYLRSDYGDATLTNDGDVLAHASGHAGRALATGLSTGEYFSSAYGVIDNSGSVTSIADIDTSGIAYAAGISGRSTLGADVANSGSVDAMATLVDGVAIATGLYASSTDGGYAQVLNEGDISAIAGVSTGDAYSIGHATGMRVRGYDAATVANAGLAAAAVVATVGDVTAYGVVSSSYHLAYLTNDIDGVIDATADTLDGDALAVGALAAGWDAATLGNYGDISAHASSGNGDAQAYAAVVDGSYTGIGLLINGGDLEATATAGAGGHAFATGAYAYANVASIFNDASSTATATAGIGGTADARGARAYGMYTAVSNYGALTASASADGGTAMARGADSLGYLGSTVYNAGDIEALASADGGVAAAFGSYSLGVIFGAYTTNTGTISAHARGDSATAHGVLNASIYYGDAITTNAGSISAVADGGIAAYGEAEAIAFGVYNFSLLYSSVVDNSGSISAIATATADIAGTDGFLQAKAVGAEAMNVYGYLDAVIANSGDISAGAITSQGYASAWGAVAVSSGLYGGTSLIDNAGSISSYAHTDIGMAVATGAYALNLQSSAEIVNHGDIVATARAERGVVGESLDFAVAYGARARSNYGSAAVSNYGNIESNASVLGGIGYSYGVVASGMYASVHNSTGASITATVEAELFGGAFVNGVTAGGFYGVDVVNNGSITAHASASGYTDGTLGFYGGSGATGILASGSFMGDAEVVNNGVVNAIAIAQNAPSMLEGGAVAVGIDGYGDAVIIANAGAVNAIAQAEFGIAGASGINAHGKYSNDITNAAGASVLAYASAGRLSGDVEPARAFAWGSQSWGADYATTYNAGSIIAHAVTVPDDTGARGDIAAAYGSTVGRYSGVVASALVNLGDIEATAEADFGYATAYGTYVHGRDEATISNTGSIRAGASAVEGNAFAVGSHAYSLNRSVAYNCDNYGCDWANPIVTIEGGQALIDNAGDILATANAVGGEGYSYGAATFAAFAAGITNTGHITAATQADDAMATAALVTSFYGDASLVNGGDIVASATGVASADAIGTIVHGANGARVDNTGRILAGAYGMDATATAVWMGDTGSNVLTNTGTIAAFGDGTRIAVSSGSGAAASILNSGSLSGAVVTGDLGDDFANATGGVWNAVGESSFGGGDDRIANAGTIVMSDATIDLGGQGGGNTFDSSGLIGVSGGNVIDMGGAFALSNTGIISFLDGAADDTLIVAGNLAGGGTISLDVSTLNQGGDRLYIDGSVISPSTQTINVNLTEVPSAPSTTIDLVSVSGTSVAGDFTLGNVNVGAGGFLNLAFDLIARIDTANASDDVFALGIDVTGLNDAGLLGVAVAPGVQSLVDAQVGTWRQRMGVVPVPGEGVMAPWLRMFSSSGDVDAQHRANFAGIDSLGFHQSNHGWELGLDLRPSEHVAVGVLLGNSDGSQHLDGGGSDRFDGRTFGLYGTWLGNNGFYVDVSQRWTGVDARLHAATGVVTATASASAFNVETGFNAWTLAGINVVPQLQYTHARIGDITPMRDGGSTLVSDGGVSSRGRLGVAFDRSFVTSGFTFTPYGSLNVVREFDGDYDYSINDGLVGTTGTEGSSTLLELGLGARKGGLSLSGGVNWTDGGAQQGVVGGQVVVRYGW